MTDDRLNLYVELLGRPDPPELPRRAHLPMQGGNVEKQAALLKRATMTFVATHVIAMEERCNGQ